MASFKTGLVFCAAYGLTAYIQAAEAVRVPFERSLSTGAYGEADEKLVVEVMDRESASKALGPEKGVGDDADEDTSGIDGIDDMTEKTTGAAASGTVSASVVTIAVAAAAFVALLAAATGVLYKRRRDRANAAAATIQEGLYVPEDHSLPVSTEQAAEPM